MSCVQQLDVQAVVMTVIKIYYFYPHILLVLFQAVNAGYSRFWIIRILTYSQHRTPGSFPHCSRIRTTALAGYRRSAGAGLPREQDSFPWGNGTFRGREARREDQSQECHSATGPFGEVARRGPNFQVDVRDSRFDGVNLVVVEFELENDDALTHARAELLAASAQETLQEIWLIRGQPARLKVI